MQRDALQLRNIALDTACNRGITFKDTQGHYNCCYYTGCIRVSLLVIGLFLQDLYVVPFLKYTTFPVYVTACDLEKSFTSDNKF